MHSLLFLLLLTGSCLAHYRSSYDTRNFIIREEPVFEDDGDYPEVECPVCNKSEQWMGGSENCEIRRGNKTYKRCTLGTYINEVCGGKLDCYRGPGEQCTVKWAFDKFGMKCAPGYYCNKSEGKCTGPGYPMIPSTQKLFHRFSRYHNDKSQFDAPEYFEPTRD